MKKVLTKHATLLFLGLLVCVMIMEGLLKSHTNGSLLLTLVFWITITEGCVALVATVEVANGKWILPLKKQLLSVYPMILIIAFMFLFLTPQLGIYPWAEHPGFWMNKRFFIARNFILLLLTFFMARKFALESMNQGKNKILYAVLYLLVFVMSQSVVAFEWVMSLEYPYINTLFGGYFFVEALYAGLAIAGVHCFLMYKGLQEYEPVAYKSTLKDTATMIFGFSLFWVGLMYTQYLVTWYGNIPEEVLFIYKRLTHSPLREFSFLMFIMLFPLTFFTLFFGKAKTNPRVVFFVSLVVILGLFLERIIFLVPVTSMSPLLITIEFLCLCFIFFMFVQSRDEFMPDVAPQ